MALVGTSSQMLALQRPVSGKHHRTSRTARIVARSSNDQAPRSRPGERRQGVSIAAPTTLLILLCQMRIRELSVMPATRQGSSRLIRRRKARLAPCIDVQMSSCSRAVAKAYDGTHPAIAPDGT